MACAYFKVLKSVKMKKEFRDEFGLYKLYTFCESNYFQIKLKFWPGAFLFTVGIFKFQLKISIMWVDNVNESHNVYQQSVIKPEFISNLTSSACI